MMRQLILLGVLGGILLQNAGALSAAGIPGSSAYVADGLVAHWDGIDNTLTDGVRSHNASATTWSDLSGNGNDIALPACVTVEANALLSAAGLNKTTADYAALAQLNGLACGSDDPPFTVEVVAQRVRWTVEGNYQNLWRRSCSSARAQPTAVVPDLLPLVAPIRTTRPVSR